ncbi:MAG: hypothetical protein AAF737_06165, partial [Pseudomonadota bacterium]
MAPLLERLRRAAGDVLLLWGWRANGVSFAAGASFAFALAPFDLFFLGFIAFPILVLLLDGAVADEPT